MRVILKTIAAGSLAVALIVVYLMRFHGLQIERDGSGIWPMFSFYEVEERMAAIEKNRMAEAVEPVAGPASVEVEAKLPAREIAELAAPPYWTDFRGPRRDGHYNERPISTNWPPEGPPRLWRKPIGEGYASFVIANGKAFTIEQRRDQEVVAAYDMDSGREVWSYGWTARFQETLGGDGPRSTPTWHAGRLYALGAEGELLCLDAQSGQLVWSKNILHRTHTPNLPWGMSASPLIVDNQVIVLPGGPQNESVVAFDTSTGERLWSALDDKQAYTSPMLVTLAGQRQILIVTATRAVGLTPNGKLLWEFPWRTSNDINVAQPVIVGPDRFLLSAGYGHGAAMVRVTKNSDGFNTVRLWENTRMKNKFTSSVLHENYIYGMDEAILACMDAETGALKWKGGRYGYGQIVLASGHLIVTAENGDIALVRATPERHEELVRFPAIDGKTWNHPAISDGVLLVRNGFEMSAFRID